MNKSVQFKIKTVKYKIISQLFLLFILLSPTVVEANTSTIAYSSLIEQINKEEVTLDLRNKTLDEILIAICKQANVKYGYHTSVKVDKQQKFSLKVNNVTVKEALNSLFTGTPYSFSINDDKIMIINRVKTNKNANVSVKGKILDEKNNPIAGATIVQMNGKSGAISDHNGNFIVNVPEGSELEVTYVGYKSKIVTANIAEMIVKLEVDVLAVKDVVVTGIFEKPKGAGEIMVWDKEDLKMNFSRNMLQTLSNLDPSFRFIENNKDGSNPNVLPEIQLRGASSLADITDLKFSTRANLNTPLFILDGFEITLEQMMDLNQDDIESITLLKDAGSTAIYGSRGANGVVVITSSMPKVGKLQVRYTGTIRIEAPKLDSYNLCSAAEKLDIELAAGLYGSTDPNEDIGFMDLYRGYKTSVDNGLNTDWLSYPTRTGIGQQHALSLNGGDKSLRYNASVSYNSNKGVMKGSERNTFNGSMTLHYTIKNFQVRNTLSVGTNTSSDSSYGSFDEIARLNPYWDVYNAEGKYQDVYYHVSNPGSHVPNPIYNASLNYWNKSNYTSVRNMTSAIYDIINGLKMEASFTISSKLSFRDSFKPASHTDFSNVGEYMKRGRYSKRETKENSYQVSGTLNYARTFGKQNLYIGLNLQMRETQNDQYSMDATGFTNDAIDHISNALTYQPNAKPSGMESTQRAIGGVITLNYNYDSRYLVDGSYRLDGSSSFGSESRFAPFYSVGAGWNVHNEKFVRNHVRFLSNMQLRYTYGVSGSLQFSPYQAMSTYEYDISQTYHLQHGAKLMAFGNPDLQWQNTFQHNVGLDIGFFDNIVTGKLTYYSKRTDNLITDLGLPISHGFENYKANMGTIRNEGYDFFANVNIIRREGTGLKWSVGGAFSRNINTLVKLSAALKKRVYEELDNMAGSSVSSINMQYREGESLDAIYVLRTLGIEPTTGRRLYYDSKGNIGYDKDVRAKVHAGNTQPKFDGRITTMLSYRGFTLNVGFQLRLGGDKINQTLLEKVENAQMTQNVDKRVFTQRWRKPGDYALYKAIGNSDATYACDMFVQKENTFTCSNVNIAYNFPEKWLRRNIGLTSLNISVSLSDIYYTSSVRQERGTSYPYSINPNIAISASF